MTFSLFFTEYDYGEVSQTHALGLGVVTVGSARVIEDEDIVSDPCPRPRGCD